ncbi:MAG TPA: helix-turn-helix transcriptional regulator [Paraburkholderia sp.]|uniref:helix-turn-helix domain-containing protein n=1 Tax=Paraburkholderia sp. TaxID=1926495 RepID=UPI002B48D638|nr:helix-turn-helix transcriptional regulator [Paraburkholderia sp.]HKR43978.1 helix-turn-helix transcriptional regulator [Paraburkholderia sp.]
MQASALRLLVATNVRLARAFLQWQQEQVADRSGLHRTYIGGIERGERNITIDNIERLAHAFGIPAWHLLNQDFNPKTLFSDASTGR